MPRFARIKKSARVAFATCSGCAISAGSRRLHRQLESTVRVGDDRVRADEDRDAENRIADIVEDTAMHERVGMREDEAHRFASFRGERDGLMK